MSWRRWTLICLVGLAAGCSDSEANRPALWVADARETNPDRANVTRGTSDGVMFEVYGAGSGSASVLEKGVEITRKGRTLQILEDRVWLDGSDRGPVRRGDKVRLEADGRLFVNNVERTDQGVQ